MADTLKNLLRGKVAVPLYDLYSRSPLGGYWRELEETQFLAEGALRERQWQRLQALLRFVWENNEFYRSRLEAAGVTSSGVASPEDLQSIPILTKEEIRKNTPRMISRGFNIANLVQFKTGGSTGKSLHIYLTEECSELRNACARRHDRWTGWEVGEPVAAVWGNPHFPRTVKERLRESLIQPYIYLDTMNVSAESVKSFAARWQRMHPTLLFGHAHSIYLLAHHVRELQINQIRPKGILSTSMMLMPFERKTMEEVFGVRVTDRYGCEEVSLIGCECEKHDGMHLNIEHLYIEFLRDDGSATPPGQPGRIVVTDLMNLAMPFIRYQVEDVGVPSDRKCACGRGLPLMERVVGRSADFLVKRDGSRVAGISLIENTLTRLAGIDQMQIIQESMERIVLKVVPGPEYCGETAAQLATYFTGLFGREVAIDIETVQAIRPEISGKYRFSICRV